ncbi:MAG: hypothetical protein AAB263_12195 [Planctomycetota bacterium]
MRINAFFFLAALTTALVAAEPAPNLVPQFATAKTGELLTWHIANAPAAWLQIDVAKTPRLTITGPDGKVFRRAAYLDQPWKSGTGATDSPEFIADGSRFLSLRHSARSVGSYVWSLAAPDGTTVTSGTLDVVAGSDPVGPIRVSRDNLRLLAFPDGTPFILNGPNLGWANTPDRATDFARYCGLLKANNCTHIRTWFASWSGKVQGEHADDLRLDHAWLMDRQLAAARANGLRVTLVMENFHDIYMGKCAPYGATPEERIDHFVNAGLNPIWLRSLSYMLARWGADDTVLAWEPMNEIDMLQPIREKALPWANAALAWLRKEDQDQRLLTLSWAGSDWGKAMALLDDNAYAQVRGYVFEWTTADYPFIEASRDVVKLFFDPFDTAQRLGKPYILAEVGFQGSNENNRGNDLDTDGLLLRQAAWGSLMLGGCGAGMNWWWDVYIDKRNLWDSYRGIGRACARLDWRDRDLVPLTPNRSGPLRVLGWTSPRQGLIWPQHINDTWYAAVAQGKPRPVPPIPMKVTLAGFIANANFRVTPLNLKSGDPRNTWEQRSDAQGRIELIVPPGTIDVVYALEKLP